MPAQPSVAVHRDAVLIVAVTIAGMGAHDQRIAEVEVRLPVVAVKVWSHTILVTQRQIMIA
jgi:hypothetical protein